MKSSGIIYPEGQDEKDIEKTFSQVSSTPASRDSPISGPAESEIENKQFNYDIPRKNIRNFSSFKTDKSKSTTSKSFVIDHEKARLREITYKDELKRIERKGNKKITKKKNKVVIKKSKRSSANKKTSLIKAKDKKRELKSQIVKGRKNESEKEESILSNILSLNIFENVILRYVVAIISGVIIFGIIFSGLGLINR